MMRHYRSVQCCARRPRRRQLGSRLFGTACLAAVAATCLAAWTAAAEEDAMTCVARYGDSLRRVAARCYGTPDLWALLQAVNGIPDAERVRRGQAILVPRSNRFFLRQVGMEKGVKIAGFRTFTESRSGLLYVGMAAAHEAATNEKPRFVLVSVAAKSYRLVFDSAAAAKKKPASGTLEGVDRWDVTDADGDGNLDVVGRVSSASSGAKPQCVFRIPRETRPSPALAKPTAPAPKDEAALRLQAAQAIHDRWPDIDLKALEAGRPVAALAEATPAPRPPVAKSPASPKPGPARPVVAPPPLVRVDSAALRAKAAEEIGRRVAGVDLATMGPGCVIYVDRGSGPCPRFVLVDWRDQRPMVVEKAKAGVLLDHPRIRAVRVKLTPEGRLLDIECRSEWTLGESGSAGDPLRSDYEQPMELPQL